MTIPDISNYNHVSSWTKVKANCPFLISRATEGLETKTTANLLNGIDRYLDRFIDGCEKNHIPYWLFVYLDKGNELAQTKYMIKVCKKKIGPYFRGYILDVEAHNKASNVKEALAWLSKQCDKCMFYTYYGMYSKYKSIITNLPSNCAYWEARTGKNTGYYDPRYPCHKNADLFQYTSKGTCEGISGKCDLNMIMSTKKGESWFTGKTEKSQPTETKVSYYPRYTGKSTKIDTVFKVVGVPSTYRGTYVRRRPIARKNGYSGNSYIGTAKQNMDLITKACKGKLVK